MTFLSFDVFIFYQKKLFFDSKFLLLFFSSSVQPTTPPPTTPPPTTVPPPPTTTTVEPTEPPSRKKIYRLLFTEKKNLKIITVVSFFSITFIFNHYISATIQCDFEKDWCQFNIKSNGDNSSINGLAWKRHNGKYIEEQNLDGPYKGAYSYQYDLILLLKYYLSLYHQ